MANVFIEHARATYEGDDFQELLDYSRPGSIDSALHKACSVEVSQVGLALILAGASAKNPSTLNDQSILHTALTGTRNLIPTLLDHGADPYIKDRNDNLPILYAARLDLSSEIEILANRGSRIDGENNEGKTAVLVALEERKPNAFRALLSLGAQCRQLEHLGDMSDSALESAMIKHRKRQQTWPDYFLQRPSDMFEMYFTFEKH